MRRKNLFLSLSPNKRNYKVGIYEGSSIVIFGTVFIVAHRRLRESIFALAFGIPVKDYLYLDSILPYAMQFEAGNWSINKRRSTVSKEEAQNALETLINMGIKISNILG